MAGDAAAAADEQPQAALRRDRIACRDIAARKRIADGIERRALAGQRGTPQRLAGIHQRRLVGGGGGERQRVHGASGRRRQGLRGGAWHLERISRVEHRPEFRDSESLPPSHRTACSRRLQAGVLARRLPRPENRTVGGATARGLGSAQADGRQAP
jgi:hypothetical protein